MSAFAKACPTISRMITRIVGSQKPRILVSFWQIVAPMAFYLVRSLEVDSI